MATQLELRLAQDPQPAAEPLARRARRLTRTFLVRAGDWTPVWAPLVFLGQIVLLGLLPAQTESRRLDGAGGEVRARAAALERERDELLVQSRMLADEMFQERVRRSLTDPQAAPLTLERAQAGSSP